MLVDAHSKYPEVVKMSSTTSLTTINVLNEFFSRQGLLELMVLDNGPQFTSHEFKEFCSNNGIHITSAVHKPSTNGQAERVVQILKSAIKQVGLSHDVPIHTSCHNWRISLSVVDGEEAAHKA